LTYIDPFTVRDGGLSVSFDGYESILILLPSLDALSKRIVESMVHGFESGLSSLTDKSDPSTTGTATPPTKMATLAAT